MFQDSHIRSLSRMALEHSGGGLRHTYNEAAFRHFLDMERRRAERSRYSLVLVVVDLQEEDRKPHTEADSLDAARLLPALARCVREVDIVGWYRAGRSAGAVLAQVGEGPGRDALRVIAGRVTDGLRGHLPNPVRVRAFQVRASA